MSSSLRDSGDFCGLVRAGIDAPLPAQAELRPTRTACTAGLLMPTVQDARGGCMLHVLRLSETDLPCAKLLISRCLPRPLPHGTL